MTGDPMHDDVVPWIEGARAELLAQFAEVQDLVAVATSADDIARATLQLVVVLHAVLPDQPWPHGAILRQLVRDAYDLLGNPDSTVSLRDWLRAAQPFVDKR